MPQLGFAPITDDPNVTTLQDPFGIYALDQHKPSASAVSVPTAAGAVLPQLSMSYVWIAVAVLAAIVLLKGERR